MKFLRFPSHSSKKSPLTRVNLCARDFAISIVNSFTFFLLSNCTWTWLMLPPQRRPYTSIVRGHTHAARCLCVYRETWADTVHCFPGRHTDTALPLSRRHWARCDWAELSHSRPEASLCS